MANVRELDVKSLPDLREMLYTVTGICDTCVAFHEKREGFYQHISYGRLREELEALGTALGGVVPHGARVLIVGKSSYAWALAFLSVSCLGGVPVPVDASLSGQALREFLTKARIDAVLCDDATAKHLSGVADLPIIPFDTFPALIARGRAAVLAGDDRFRTAPLSACAPAAVFYTAGRAGGALGVVLSHQGILATLSALGKALPVSDADIFLSVLPLSCAYECVAGLLFPLSRGASVAFCEGVGTIMRNMREIHPTCMVAVPYLATRIHDKFWELVGDAGNEAAIRRAIAISDPVRPLAARQSLKERLLAAARQPFGGALRTMLVVGDISPAVCKGLRQIGIFAAQGYGITECAGVAAVNTREAYRDGTVGLPLAGITVDIYNKQKDGSGEIRLKGDGVMLGYDGDAASTKAAVQNGWYYTGDLGRIDKDGFLHVIGRRQNCIERANGTLVSPEELEQMIAQSPLVSEAAVVGVLNDAGSDHEPAALIVPDADRAVEVLGTDYTEEELEAAVAGWLSELNAAQPDAAKIAVFALRESPLPRNKRGRLLRTTLAAELDAACREAGEANE